jgi:hypothetical protein
VRLCGIGALAIVGYDVVTQPSRLAGNPVAFRGDAMLHTSRSEWGWLPLVGGALLVLAAAWLSRE